MDCKDCYWHEHEHPLAKYNNNYDCVDREEPEPDDNYAVSKVCFKPKNLH